MASAPPLTNIGATTWTAVDLVDRFGPIPLDRILNPPEPGTATVEDVTRLNHHQDRLCELIDGTLVEKTMGANESYYAVELAAILRNYIRSLNVGIVLGADGMLQIFPQQVRIPDVCFISWQRLQGSGFPHQPAPTLAPDLAVEVLSESNTRREMERKLQDYFNAGVKLVWYIDPRKKSVHVYTAPNERRALSESDTLTGGEVLPGFELPLQSYFARPWEELPPTVQ